METNSEPGIATERRRHPRLRARFDEARKHLDHVFNHNREWAGSDSDYLALRVIHEAYPDLNADEVRILTHAIERRIKDEIASITGTFRLPDDESWEQPGR